MQLSGLLDEPDRHWVAVEFPVAGLDGGDDDEDRVQEPEHCEGNEADQNKTEDRGNGVVDQHRDLEVDRFLAVRVELGRFGAFNQPQNERREEVARKVKETPNRALAWMKAHQVRTLAMAATLAGGRAEEDGDVSIAISGTLFATGSDSRKW
jgi:hypothetical protein